MCVVLCRGICLFHLSFTPLHFHSFARKINKIKFIFLHLTIYINWFASSINHWLEADVQYCLIYKSLFIYSVSLSLPTTSSSSSSHRLFLSHSIYCRANKPIFLLFTFRAFFTITTLITHRIAFHTLFILFAAAAALFFI